jgi:hypothetical protein
VQFFGDNLSFTFTIKKVVNFFSRRWKANKKVTKKDPKLGYWPLVIVELSIDKCHFPWLYIYVHIFALVLGD